MTEGRPTVCDPVPADAVELCCPRCQWVVGHCTRTRLYVGGASWADAIRLPCANCRYRFRWGPDPAATQADLDTAPQPRSH